LYHTPGEKALQFYGEEKKIFWLGHFTGDHLIAAWRFWVGYGRIYLSAKWMSKPENVNVKAF
jgi:hypothetical protein